MKPNITALKKYGITQGKLGESKWAMLSYGGIDSQFIDWGAEESVEVGHHGEYTKYMVRMGNLWFYAHKNSTSCFMSLERAYPAKSGRLAYQMHKHDLIVGNYIHSLKEVVDLEKQSLDGVAAIDKELGLST